MGQRGSPCSQMQFIACAAKGRSLLLLLLLCIPHSCSFSFQWGNSAHNYPGLQKCKQSVLHVFKLQPCCSTHVQIIEALCSRGPGPGERQRLSRVPCPRCPLPWLSQPQHRSRTPTTTTVPFMAPPALPGPPGAGPAAQQILTRSLLRGCLNRGNCFTL